MYNKLVLLIETCCGECSVAIAGLNKENRTLSLRHKITCQEKNMQAEKLSSMVNDLIKEYNFSQDNIDSSIIIKSENNSNSDCDQKNIFDDVVAIVLTNGPGSFTGSRIALSYAYGIKIGLRKEFFPIITVNTLECIAAQKLQSYTDILFYEKNLLNTSNMQIDDIYVKTAIPAGINVWYFAQYIMKYTNIDFFSKKINFIILTDIEPTTTYDKSIENNVGMPNAEDIIFVLNNFENYSKILNLLLYLLDNQSNFDDIESKKVLINKAELIEYPEPYYLMDPRIG